MKTLSELLTTGAHVMHDLALAEYDTKYFPRGAHQSRELAKQVSKIVEEHGVQALLAALKNAAQAGADYAISQDENPSKIIELYKHLKAAADVR